MSKSGPRNTDGHPLRYIDRAYAVCLGPGDVERSERAWGDAWFAFEGVNVGPRLFFMPDHSDTDGNVPLIANGYAGWFGVGLEEEGLIWRSPLGGVATDGSRVTLDLSEMFGSMA